MFRPFRNVSDIAARVGPTPWRHGPAEYRKAFVAEFVDWEKGVLETAARFDGRCDPLGEIWWAEQTRQAIRNYDFAADKHGTVADSAPGASALADLPIWQAVAGGVSANTEPCDDALMESESYQDPIYNSRRVHI